MVITGSASAAMSGGTASEPIAAYRQRIVSGVLQTDPAQALAAEKLQALHHALLAYRPVMGAYGWRERLGLTRRREDPPQGLYLYGPVGRGKSMLMDLFFAACPLPQKRRVHFHAFMRDVHDLLHDLRREGDDGFDSGAIIQEAAERLAKQAWLLCFDEFHVTNIADAMLLGRLFTALFDHGVVVVATSNFAPDDLYKGGLQRDRFLPFIDLLKQKLDILALDAGQDYRRARLRDRAVYFSPLGAESSARLSSIVQDLIDATEFVAETLTIQGRALKIARTAKGLAWFKFAELCETALGAADYWALAGQYHSIAIDDVPIFDEARRDEARRFMTLVDALYEHRCQLLCTAAAAADQLCQIDALSFEFQRTSSRLFEMQSGDYRQRSHLS